MDHFTYVDGRLRCERIDLVELVTRFGTPTYVYSKRTLLDHYDRIEEAFAPLNARVCFSVKSCHNLSILRLLGERGSSFDVVSGGEIRRVLDAGADPDRVVYAGVGKTEPEIRLSIESRIGWFNAESEAELEMLARVAAEFDRPVNVALRVNPDVDPHTHQYTTTGTRTTKFGLSVDRTREMFTRYGRDRLLRLRGLHVHIGSPVRSVKPYVASVRCVLELIDELRGRGHRIDAINIGGGFAAYYEGDDAPPAAEYAAALVPLLGGADLRVILEPGRSITANAGVLLTRTILNKSAATRRYVVVDAAMNDLIRPALYDAFHFVWPVVPANGLVPTARRRGLQLPGTVEVDVVGPVCESGDFLATSRHLPPVEPGDLLAIFSAGAYGMVMSSQYNSRPRAAEVLVDGADLRLIRRRETYDDLVTAERIEPEGA